MINDGENGFIYKNGNEDDLFNKVKFLLDNPEKRKEMSLNAYKTMAETWNAENAVKKFLKLIIGVFVGKKLSIEGGPCEISS